MSAKVPREFTQTANFARHMRVIHKLTITGEHISPARLAWFTAYNKRGRRAWVGWSVASRTGKTTWATIPNLVHIYSTAGPVHALTWGQRSRSQGCELCCWCGYACQYDCLVSSLYFVHGVQQLTTGYLECGLMYMMAAQNSNSS